MTFQHPSVWLLCLLALLPVALFIRWWHRSTTVVEFSSLHTVMRSGTTWRVWMRWIVPTLRLFGLGLLIVAIARPQEGNEQTRVHREGIAIQMIVDRSGSMRATDFRLDGHEADRLTVVKKIMQEFVTGGEDLPGRPDDLIGVIQFASFADSTCPITLDHSHVVDVIEQTKPATQAEGMGTAIGDAVALGVERLAGLSRRQDLVSEGEIKSRIMILLTDGENS
ncbi:MAG TPA: VWA domain-containing protein, partial [Phycisphaerales bacterium]|nr:VWA domain-containing protein [Phycisphaerales bacterium]